MAERKTNEAEHLNGAHAGFMFYPAGGLPDCGYCERTLARRERKHEKHLNYLVARHAEREALESLIRVEARYADA